MNSSCLVFAACLFITGKCNTTAIALAHESDIEVGMVVALAGIISFHIWPYPYEYDREDKMTTIIMMR